MIKKIISIIGISGLLSLFIFGCGSNKKPNNQPVTTTQTAKNDTTQSNLIKVNGQLFSIPSPIQTALLIKKTNPNYNASILNNPKNATNYLSNASKALNLGVYGTDLCYVTLYNQTQDAINYLTSANALAEALGVTGTFNKDLVTKFQRDLGKQDSLLSLVSDAYKSANAFLKSNQRKDISSLILAGGWIESLYLAINANKTAKSQELTDRIGQQKNSLDNLIKLLTPLNTKPDVAKLITQLNDLKTAFDKVETKYEFVAPTTDTATKTTTIKSKTSVTITPDELSAIAQKVGKIRSSIIG